MKNRLAVHTEARFSGLLTHDKSYVFAYDLRAAPEAAVSLTMPVRQQVYDRPTLHPIFQMNLPEGYLLERLRNLLSKSSTADPMVLLPLLGGESAIGRLRYSVDGLKVEAAAVKPSGERLADILAHRGAGGLFDSLIDRYLFRSGLSGVQPKALVPLRQEPDAVLAFDAPPTKAVAFMSDLIVKSGSSEFPGLAINEFVCMTVAKRAGIPCPVFYLSDDRSLFVMQRFDRRADGSAIGFEDMAVLSAKDAARKYEGRYEDMARLVRAYCSPQHVRRSLAQLFDMVALSCLLGNGDAHLKNFGVLYDDVEAGPVHIAPAFDIVNTTCYLPQDSLALSLVGNKSFFASRLTLLDFAGACDVPVKAAKSRILELCDIAASVFSEFAELADEVPGLVDEVEKSVELFRRSFAATS
jgi:serine/threonine-protein kinase HipA